MGIIKFLFGLFGRNDAWGNEPTPSAPDQLAPTLKMPQPVPSLPMWLQLCLPLTKYWEKCVLVAYWDSLSSSHPWTVGYGATGAGIAEGTVWTQEQADSDLISRLMSIRNEIRDAMTLSAFQALTDAELAALVDFVYNEGIGHFQSSTLLKCLNSNDMLGAANQFPIWDMAGGVEITGLENRRIAEKTLFTTGSWSVPT